MRAPRILFPLVLVWLWLLPAGVMRLVEHLPETQYDDTVVEARLVTVEELAAGSVSDRATVRVQGRLETPEPARLPEGGPRAGEAVAAWHAEVVAAYALPHRHTLVMPANCGCEERDRAELTLVRRDERARGVRLAGLAGGASGSATIPLADEPWVVRADGSVVGTPGREVAWIAPPTGVEADGLRFGGVETPWPPGRDGRVRGKATVTVTWAPLGAPMWVVGRVNAATRGLEGRATEPLLIAYQDPEAGRAWRAARVAAAIRGSIEGGVVLVVGLLVLVAHGVAYARLRGAPAEPVTEPPVARSCRTCDDLDEFVPTIEPADSYTRTGCAALAIAGPFMVLIAALRFFVRFVAMPFEVALARSRTPPPAS